ncbi:MAG: hypothetical protein AAF630_18665 [Cyanobacteria bacterium P01_C01_bin.38]
MAQISDAQQRLKENPQFKYERISLLPTEQSFPNFQPLLEKKLRYEYGYATKVSRGR